MTESYNTLDSEKLRQHYKEQIQELKGLPSLPEIVLELQHIIREDKLSAGQIAPIIDRDPSLAIKVLKLANSAYYGTSRKLDSLRQAIVILGIKGISNLVIGISLIQAFDVKDDDAKINWKGLWEHSNLVGNFCELLNSKLKLWIPASPFTLGLLHDIGKLVLFKLDPDKYYHALEFAKINEIPSYQSEIEYFGITHMDAGGWIAEQWGLPEATQYAIGYHHAPENTPDIKYHECVKLVKLSNLLLNYHDIRFGNHLNAERLKDEFTELELFDNIKFNGNIDNLDEIIDDLSDYIATLKGMVSI